MTTGRINQVVMNSGKLFNTLCQSLLKGQSSANKTLQRTEPFSATFRASSGTCSCFYEIQLTETYVVSMLTSLQSTSHDVFWESNHTKPEERSLK